jgi:hypothetical protein
LVLQDFGKLKYLPGSNKITKCCGDVVEVVFIVDFIDGAENVGVNLASVKQEE